MEITPPPSAARRAAADSQNTIFHLSKQKQNKTANNPKLGSVFLPVKLQFREKR